MQQQQRALQSGVRQAVSALSEQCRRTTLLYIVSELHVLLAAALQPSRTAAAAAAAECRLRLSSHERLQRLLMQFRAGRQLLLACAFEPLHGVADYELRDPDPARLFIIRDALQQHLHDRDHDCNIVPSRTRKRPRPQQHEDVPPSPPPPPPPQKKELSRREQQRQKIVEALSRRSSSSSSSAPPPPPPSSSSSSVTANASWRMQLTAVRRQQHQRWRRTVSSKRPVITLRSLEERAQAERRHGIGQRTLVLSNAFRRDQGRPQLKWHQTLADVACDHSRAMATGQVPFGHEGFELRVRKFPFRTVTSAENVAYSNGCDDPAKTAVDGWIQSPGHRKNLLSNTVWCGVGVFSSNNGTVYLTQLFARASSN